MDWVDPNVHRKQLRPESLERIEVGQFQKCGELVACPHHGVRHPAVAGGEVCAIDGGAEARLEQPFDNQQHAHSENDKHALRPRTHSKLGPRFWETEKLHFDILMNESAGAAASPPTMLAIRPSAARKTRLPC